MRRRNNTLRDTGARRYPEPQARCTLFWIPAFAGMTQVACMSTAQHTPSYRRTPVSRIAGSVPVVLDSGFRRNDASGFPPTGQQLRHTGARRYPESRAPCPLFWIPAFAGMTLSAGEADLARKGEGGRDGAVGVAGRRGVAAVEPRAPRIRRDQAGALPHRGDAAVGGHLADDRRLVQMMVHGVHGHLEAARRLDA